MSAETDTPDPFGAGTDGGRPALLLFDGSPGARAAVRQAAAILAGAPAFVVCLWEPADRALLARTTPPHAWAAVAGLADELDAAARAEGQRTAGHGAALAGELGLSAQPLAARATRPPWRAVARLVEAHGARAVVLGARGRSCARALVDGSLSHAAIHQLHCPVLVVPPDAAPAEVPRLAEKLAGPVDVARPPDDAEEARDGGPVALA